MGINIPLQAVCASLIFVGCSAEYHYNKACKKDSSYCATSVQLDTVVVTDSFYTQRVDTLKKIDTITIDTGGVKIRVLREYDTFTIRVLQKPDTIKVTMVKKVKPKIVTIYKTPLWVFILCIIIFMFLLKRLFR